jgi:inner membrane transporter RhtA
VRPPPALLVVLSSTSIQFGTAIATTAFVAVGPIGAVWVRGIVGAALLFAWVRPDVRRITPAQWRAIVPYGLALGLMVLAIYLALVDTPLGIVSAILMLGPLTVSALGYRTPVDLAAVGLAAVGVTLLALAGGVDGTVTLSGLGLSLIAAAAFGAYILTGKQLGKRIEGFDGLSLGLVVAVIVQAPLAIATLRPGIADPTVLVTLAAAGVLASLIPFALELNAMRALSAATFGLLLSFEPAIAALAGFVIRGQELVPQQLLGIGFVVVASAASLGPRGWTRRLGRYNREVMADPTVAALARVPLFSGLSTRDLAAIAAHASEREVPAGTEITHQGDPGDEFFIVANGAVDIRIDEHSVRRLGPGDFLGEIALVFGGTRTATAVAVEPATLYVLGRSDFDAMVKRYPRIEDKILTSVSERMRYR